MVLKQQRDAQAAQKMEQEKREAGERLQREKEREEEAAERRTQEAARRKVEDDAREKDKLERDKAEYAPLLDKKLPGYTVRWNHGESDGNIELSHAEKKWRKEAGVTEDDAEKIRLDYDDPDVAARMRADRAPAAATGV